MDIVDDVEDEPVAAPPPAPEPPPAPPPPAPPPPTAAPMTAAQAHAAAEEDGLALVRSAERAVRVGDRVVSPGV